MCRLLFQFLCSNMDLSQGMYTPSLSEVTINTVNQTVAENRHFSLSQLCRALTISDKSIRTILRK